MPTVYFIGGHHDGERAEMDDCPMFLHRLERGELPLPWSGPIPTATATISSEVYRRYDWCAGVETFVTYSPEVMGPGGAMRHLLESHRATLTDAGH
jgi:hypothetical protein